MEININPEQVIQYFNLGLLILFGVIIAVFLIGFVRGLRQGWKYGTYRFIFFALLIAGALFTLKPLGDWVANFDLSSFNQTIRFNMNVDSNTVSIEAPLITIKETGTNIVTQILKAFNVNADPATVTAYAINVATSVGIILALMVEAVLISIVGNLICFLLWHILFKWFIPEESRKLKNLKVLSGFEQAITSLLIFAMFISPLTGMVNSISRNFERIPEGEENSNRVVVDSKIYQTITGCIDTYDNSLFSKAFFSWYADGQTGMRFDEAFLSYISTVDLASGDKFTIVNEFANIIQAASYAIDGGILGDEGFNSQSITMFATSQYAPKILRTLGQSKLIQEIAPVVFKVVLNMESIAQYVMTEEGIDVSRYDHVGTFNKLADLYETVVSSGILNEVIDETSGEFSFTTETVANAFAPKYQPTFDAVFETLSSSELRFLNDLLCSVIYVQAVKEYQKAAEAEEGVMVIGVKDLLPELSSEQLSCTSEGRPVAIPESIKQINFVSELKIVFDSMFELINVDEQFLPTIISPLLDAEQEAFGSETIKELVTLVLDNLDDVEKFIDGRNLEDGKSCLLDSQLIANAVPTFLEMLEAVTNEGIELEGEDRIELDSVIADYKTKTLEGKKEAAKNETKNLLSVLRPLASSEEGKALIKDFDNLPGLYFDKNGSFLGAKKELLMSLAEGLSSLDDSKVFSSLLPSVLNKYLGGETGFLKESLNLDLTLDFSPKDTNGNSILGHEIASVIRTYAECQDSVAYLMGAIEGSSDIRSLEKAFSTICTFKTSSNELQITKLLTMIGNNKIFNPIGDNHGTPVYNESIYELFKMILDTVGFNTPEIDADLKNIIMEEGFDFGNEINAFVGLLQHLCDNQILGSFTGGLSLDKMAEISFADLFGKVSDSELLKTILGDIIDSNLDSVTIFSFVDQGGETVKLSFKDITDWEVEGAALDSMMKYATLVGDISSIALESLDPEMLSSLFGYFSTSQLFVKTYEDGSHDWLLPKYLASKIVKIAKGAGDMGKFFADMEESYVGGEYKVEGKDPVLDTSYEKLKFDILEYNLEGVSLSDIEDGQSAFQEEGERLAEIIRCLNASGALDLISDGIDANLSSFKITYLDALLETMSESILMGRTGITQILATVSSMLKDSNEPFGHVNVMYAYNTDNIDERKEVGKAITSILEAAVDPVTGLLGADGKIDSAKFSHVEDLDANHFVAPMLHALNSTEAFTTLSDFQVGTAGMTESTFLGEMSVVLKSSSWYGNDARVDALLPTIDEQLVNTPYGWDQEIDRFVKVFNDLQIMGVDIAGELSFDDFFKEEKYGEDVVGGLLCDINSSYLLFPGFPEKLDSAFQTLETGSLAGSGISLANANTYFTGKQSKETFDYASNPYNEDECYKLASILGKASKLGSIDLTDIGSLGVDDINNVTGLLADFAQSEVFNTLKQGETTSVFQDIMGTILGGDNLKEYYFNSISPKDIANASNYGTALEKAKYTANVEYPYISNSNSNSDVTNLIDSSSPRSLRSLLITLTSDSDYISALSNGTVDSLDETKMSLLFDALNKCDWTYDIVPNAIADSINNVSLDAVEIKRADPFYEYGFSIAWNGSSYENSGITCEPNFGNRYDDAEIEAVAKVVALVKNNSTLTTDLSSKTKVKVLKDFLVTLSESYGFNLAGPSYILKADDSPEYTTTDLTVFRQTMFNLYKQSGLGELAYNPVYDAQYKTFEDKLLTNVRNYQNSDWGTEIENLMINDTEDAGLMNAAFDLGLLVGGSVSISSSSIMEKNPDDLSKLLYAANKVDLAHELVAYELQKTINDTINFKKFSSTEAKYTVNGTSFDLGLNNAVYSLEISMASGVAPTVSYQRAGETKAIMPTGSNPYTYTLFDGSAIKDRPLGKDIVIEGTGTISTIKASFTADDEINLTQDEYDVEIAPGVHKGAIKELISIAKDCFYDSSNEAYMDFESDPNALANLFSTAGNLTKIMNFIKSEDSFFTNGYDASFAANGENAFDAGDITVAGILSFQSGGHSVNLFEYMPDYDSADFVPGFVNLASIFSKGSVTAVSEWLDEKVLEAALFYGAYNSLSNIQLIATGVPLFEYSGENVMDYLSCYAEWDTFEAAFKNGFCRRMYGDMREAVMTSGHFSGNVVAESEFVPSSADFKEFISLTRSKLLPLLRDLKYTGLSNKNDAGTILNELSDVAAGYPCKDVISSYYEKAIYEALVGNEPLNYGTQPTNCPEPFGAAGYLRNSAVILNPSLA